MENKLTIKNLCVIWKCCLYMVSLGFSERTAPATQKPRISQSLIWQKFNGKTSSSQYRPLSKRIRREQKSLFNSTIALDIQFVDIESANF